MGKIPSGLVEWARLPGPALVLAEVRRRAAKGARTEQGTLPVGLTASQRREVARLLGTPWEISDRAVRLQDLAAALAEHGLTVRSLVEGIDGGPLVNVRLLRADERASARAAAERERSAVVELLVATGIHAFAATTWLDDHGLPKAGSGDLWALTEQVARVWRQLPSRRGVIPLAQLAATVADNDAHALDYDRLLGRAVARLVAVAHGLPRPLRAGRAWRRAWGHVGVRCDGVSSRVLVLNLPLAGEASAARWSGAVPGEPLWLTLRSISGLWTAPADATFFVCENVTVLEAAADRLGADSRPVICTDGNPANVALDLIAGLSAAGCPIRVRADFDAAGLGIVDQVRSVAPAAAGWRYDASTYAAHLGLDVPAPVESMDEWAQLHALYAQHNTAVHEEAILDQLVADLVAPMPSDRDVSAR